MSRIASRRSIGGSHRAYVLVIAAVMVAAALFGALVASEQAGAWAAPSKTRPLLLVGGYNATTTSNDCEADYGAMKWQMANRSWFAQIVKVGFYSGDRNCDVNLHLYSYYQDRDSWKEIAKAFSWYVWDNYTRHGVQVDAVGYSMGGLIIRGAVHGARTRAPGFSPPINLSGAVTLGTPHNGAAWYANACFWGQCASLKPGTGDLNWLNGDCDPQGTTGTMWTVFGSNIDGVAPWPSAIGMCTYVDHKIVVEHATHLGPGNYMHQWSVNNQVMNALGVWPSRFTSGLNRAKCIDVRGGSAAPRTPVQLYDCNGQLPQLWTHDELGWPTTIQALGRCLDVKDGIFRAGQPVWLYPCNGGAAQTWHINDPGGFLDGTIRIQGFCLDVPGADARNENQLWLWHCNGHNAQRWYLG